MSGLRVAVDVTPLVGARTGVAQCVEHLLAALPEAAPEVEVVPYVLSRRAREHAALLPRGTRFLRLPATAALHLWARADRPGAGGLLDDVDVVHGTNFVVPPTRHASTITVQDTWCLLHPAECEARVRPFDRIIRRAVARGAWLHASSRAVERQLVERYGTARVAQVPFGIPPVGEAGPLPERVSGRYVLAISTLDRRKRHEHLVRAFAAAAPGAPDLQLVIAGGDGNAAEDVRRAVDALPGEVRARVLLLGRVDEAGRAALVRGATVLAHPSADEGFGFPVLEAMAVGVPVVATRAGAIPEVAGDAALLVPVEDDPTALAEALRAVVADGGLRDRLARRGRDQAATFTWEQHAAGMAALWREAAR